MLRSINEMIGYHLLAQDGRFGTVRDFLIDDRDWRLKYLVVESGILGLGRMVLVPAGEFVAADRLDRSVVVSLDQNTLESQPPPGEDAPRSRQHKVEIFLKTRAQPYRLAKVTTSGDPHLRSFQELRGYRVGSRGGEAGRVVDLIYNGKTGKVCCLVVNTGGRWLGKRVLIVTGQVLRIDQDNSQILVDLPRQEIVTRMPYHPTAPVNRTGETERYDYLGRRALR